MTESEDPVRTEEIGAVEIPSSSSVMNKDVNGETDEHSEGDAPTESTTKEDELLPPPSDDVTKEIPEQVNDGSTCSEEKKTTDEPTSNTDAAESTELPSIAINAMDLNVAYKALEDVRKANVSIEFGREVGAKECIPCVRVQQQLGIADASTSAAPPPTRKDRLRKFVVAKTAQRPNLRAAEPCLACGTPVCPRHRCQALKRENINICLECSQFFNLEEYFAQIMTDHFAHENGDAPNNTIKIGNDNTPGLSIKERRQHMNHMLDVYDRALLVLQYSCKFIEDVATALEKNTKRNNQIGLGSSATNFVSGIAGVAAAATIFTPVGPPLLIASILFGGGATAASAGSEAVNYRCSANKMADTILALYGLVHSISHLTTTAADNNEKLGINEEDTAESCANNNNDSDNSSKNNNNNNNNNNSGPQSRRVNHNDDSGQRRNWVRGTANALKPLTAGALSAASVVMEAREMRATLDKINAGNPCSKAESLREIGSQVDNLPSTTVLAQSCPKFFQL